MNGLVSYYPVLKGLHLAFMVTWFAGLFYLPRLFIYHVEARDDAAAHARFQVMEKRLFGIMTIGAALTTLFGLLLLAANPGLLERPWFLFKLALLVGLGIFHYRCHGWRARLRRGEFATNTRWLRWFNEIPVFFLFAIILLAVTKTPG